MFNLLNVNIFVTTIPTENIYYLNLFFHHDLITFELVTGQHSISPSNEVLTPALRGNLTFQVIASTSTQVNTRYVSTITRYVSTTTRYVSTTTHITRKRETMKLTLAEMLIKQLHHFTKDKRIKMNLSQKNILTTH